MQVKAAPKAQPKPLLAVEDRKRELMMDVELVELSRKAAGWANRASFSLRDLFRYGDVALGDEGLKWRYKRDGLPHFDNLHKDREAFMIVADHQDKLFFEREFYVAEILTVSDEYKSLLMRNFSSSSLRPITASTIAKVQALFDDPNIFQTYIDGKWRPFSLWSGWKTPHNKQSFE